MNLFKLTNKKNRQPITRRIYRQIYHTHKAHINIKSHPERHTINRAELATITLTLELYRDSPRLRILTDSAFSINTIRNYIIDLLNYTHHLHRELLLQANNLIKTRDHLGLITHIGRSNPTQVSPITTRRMRVPVELSMATSSRTSRTPTRTLPP
jgi:hypothetical protein